MAACLPDPGSKTAPHERIGNRRRGRHRRDSEMDIETEFHVRDLRRSGAASMAASWRMLDKVVVLISILSPLRRASRILV